MQTKSKRILFIFPPTRIHREGVKQSLPALGVASLAAAVRDRAEVRILDATAEGFETERPSSQGFYIYGLSPEEIGRRISDFRPDLVGISCLYSSMFPVVAEICRVSKSVAPDALTITGGTHPTFLARRCLEQVPDLDMIALGEGETVLEDLLDALEQDQDLAGVRGLAFRDNAGKIRINSQRRLLDDLDSLAFPARDLLPMERYQRIGTPHLLTRERRRYATLMTSRGCPARCSFCSSWKFWGNRFRARSAGKVLEELTHLVDDHGIEEVHFEDDNLGCHPARFKEILQGMLDRRLGLKWATPNGLAVWALDESLIELMGRAGCYEVTLAIESGCQEVLDRIIHKPARLDKIPPLLQAFERAGIRVSSFFVVGFPGESLDQMKQTFALPRELGLQGAWFFIANPLPGTDLYESCRRDGLLEEGFDFVDNSFSRCHLKTALWTSEQVERLAHREFLKFNLYNLARHPLAQWRRYKSVLKNPRLLAQIAQGLVRRNLPRPGPGRQESS